MMKIFFFFNKEMVDPISHQMYIKQLEKIKNRKNLYLPKENSIKKELKELSEKIIKLKKEIKINDALSKTFKKNKKMKRVKTINLNLNLLNSNEQLKK